MYNVYSVVSHVVAPLMERANRGIATLGVLQDSVLSIEDQTLFLGRALGRLKAAPVMAKDIGIIRAALQSGYMFKKFRYGGNPTARAAAAIEGFIARNDSCRSTPESYLKKTIQARMRVLLERALPVSEVWKPRFGGGAVAEHIPWLARWERIARHPALLQGFQIPMTMDLTLHGGETVRLCAVPKDYAKDRLITVEPWLNTWVQHATRRLIYESIHCGPLRGTAMDAMHVDGVSLQRELAVEGSKYGNYDTLDLSDASDHISLADVEAVFPPWVLSYLLACRTEGFETPDGRRGTVHMYAGMGNATTFVVETLYFWAACSAIGELAGIRRPFVSVYGDDIVTESRVTREIIAGGGLESLGLVLNHGKSYWGDCSFRESCGVWALRGYDVTPSRFDGFDLGQASGRIGFADVIRRMLGSGCGMQLLMADRLAKGSCMSIVPYDAPGTQTLPDLRQLWHRRHTVMNTRLDNDLQVLQVRAEMPVLATCDVPADRSGYLFGALLGCVSTNVRHGRIRADGLRPCNHVVTIPTPRGETRLRKRWVTLEGFPTGAHSPLR